MYGKYRCTCKCVFKHLIFLVLEVTDLIFDWWFFVDVLKTLNGFQDRITQAILAFCIISSITFIVQLVNRCFKCVEDETLSAIVVWIEDVPQIILSLLITLCVGETVMNVQYYKVAAVVVNSLSVAVHITVLCRQCCCADDVNIYCKVFIILGTLIELSIAIFIIINEQCWSERKFPYLCNIDNSTLYA